MKKPVQVTVTKYYCDACGTEIDSVSDRNQEETVHFCDNHRGARGIYESLKLHKYPKTLAVFLEEVGK